MSIYCTKFARVLAIDSQTLWPVVKFSKRRYRQTSLGRGTHPQPSGASLIIPSCRSKIDLPKIQYHSTHSQVNDVASGSASSSKRRLHRCYIAIGSNVGDRLKSIDNACAEMSRRGIGVKRTSSLYETEPMYVLDQDRFLNAVCEVDTIYSPHELLHELKAIENDLGRHKSIDKGPRAIDLDILLYDDVSMDDGPSLSIPHKAMLERKFVLQPLCDLIPDKIASGYGFEENLEGKSTFQKHLDGIAQSPDALFPSTPLSPDLALSPTNPSRKSHIMAILNITPDSFSDGNTYSANDLASIATAATQLIDEGATILDIGGESTRPGALPITAEEELSRVIPVIQTVRKLPSAAKVAISVDTYRATVARAAVDAGANMINDVSGGRGDIDMLSTAASLHVPIVLMHSRGTPENMVRLTNYPRGVLQTVGLELEERLQAAEKAGVRRWHIILDPGLGFAKTYKQNLDLLGGFSSLRDRPRLLGLPWLVGPSRKGFVGKATGVQTPRDRIWGTAAAVTAAIQGGADIIRVHDASAMAQVAKMADAIWRH